MTKPKVPNATTTTKPSRITFKKFNTHKDRGLAAEKATQDFLKLWAAHTGREYNRLIDSKAAGRIVKSAPADFEFFAMPDRQFHGLIEVKQTEHNYRLARDKLPQLPSLRKRAQCGGYCIVLVCHSSINRWRAVFSEWLTDNGDKGSWNLTELDTYDTPGEALAAMLPAVFA